MSARLDAERLVAHRGWQNRYPENTLLAVEAAMVAGARHVEIDIQFSGDGHPMVFHDSNLLRLCGVDRDIHTCSLAELGQFTVSAALRLGGHETDTSISPLSEIAGRLAHYRAVTLYVEIKTDILNHFSREQTLTTLARVLGEVRDQIVLISFDYAILLDAARQGWRVGPVLGHWDDLANGLLPASAHCLFLDYQQVPPGQDLRALPYSCVVYEIGNRELALDWLARGADKIETYCIGELLET